MLHYNMPLQRKNVPGKRQFSERYLKCGYGWYSQLSKDERDSLNDPCVKLSTLPLSEDSDYGICRNELYGNKISSVPLHDQINSDMFRNPEEDACSFIGYIAGKHYPSSNNNISKPQGTTIVVPTLNVGANNKRDSVNISASNSVGCTSVAKRTKTQETNGTKPSFSNKYEISVPFTGTTDACSETASVLSTKSVTSNINNLLQSENASVIVDTESSELLIARIEKILTLTMKSSQTAHCNVILEIQSVLNNLNMDRLKKKFVV